MLSTIIAGVATIAGGIAILMAWFASRQNKELTGRLDRTNQRVNLLREEMEREQLKLTQEKRRLQSEVARLKGDGNGVAQPEETGELGTAQMMPPPIREITPQQLKTRLDNGDELVVVDMRQPFEYQSGHIPGAINIFIEHIPARMKELPPDKEIIFQCWHGNTSLQASAYLIDNGWTPEQVASLSGGMAGWAQTHGMDSLVKD